MTEPSPMPAPGHRFLHELPPVRFVGVAPLIASAAIPLTFPVVARRRPG